MEIVDIYDGKKNKTGKTVERSTKPELGEYRLSIHIWITNSKGELLIQRRSANKKMFPRVLQLRSLLMLNKAFSYKGFILSTFCHFCLV